MASREKSFFSNGCHASSTFFSTDHRFSADLFEPHSPTGSGSRYVFPHTSFRLPGHPLSRSRPNAPTRSRYSSNIGNCSAPEWAESVNLGVPPAYPKRRSSLLPRPFPDGTDVRTTCRQGSNATLYLGHLTAEYPRKTTHSPEWNVFHSLRSTCPPCKKSFASTNPLNTDAPNRRASSLAV